MLLIAGVTALLHAAERPGLPNGHLVIHGGGESTCAIDEFVRLAGGRDAKVIVIPTAAGRDQYDAAFQENYFRSFRERGVVDISLLHTNDRAIADSDAFVAPLAEATGVWFTGGRQWRLAAAYVDTKTERAFWTILRRGGVIGGGSAGATIQGSYLVRGDTRGTLQPTGDHLRGFGFLQKTAIDQHLLSRNRHLDLVSVIRAHPELLGLGLDDDACIVVRGDEFRVIGDGYVAVYDPRLILASGAYYFLRAGQRFSLSTRTPLSSSGEPLWLPHLQPRFSLTTTDLAEIAGTYTVPNGDPIQLTISGGRIRAELCAGDYRELIPISREVLYDSIDGSRVTIDRHDAAVTGLTWHVERIVGQQICRQGKVLASKVRPRR
jgi:cyanophycinase